MEKLGLVEKLIQRNMIQKENISLMWIVMTKIVCVLYLGMKNGIPKINGILYIPENI